MKSYSLNIQYPFYDIYIRVKKPDNLIITERMATYIFNKMIISEFNRWAQQKINYDMKYVNENDFYCFTILANKHVVKKDDIKYIKPVYPWKTKIYEEIKTWELKDLLQIKKINEQAEIIKKLKKEIKSIKSK